MFKFCVLFTKPLEKHSKIFKPQIFSQKDWN